MMEYKVRITFNKIHMGGCEKENTNIMFNTNRILSDEELKDRCALMVFGMIDYELISVKEVK